MSAAGSKTEHNTSVVWDPGSLSFADLLPHPPTLSWKLWDETRVTF